MDYHLLGLYVLMIMGLVIGTVLLTWALVRPKGTPDEREPEDRPQDRHAP